MLQNVRKSVEPESRLQIIAPTFFNSNMSIFFLHLTPLGHNLFPTSYPLTKNEFGHTVARFAGASPPASGDYFIA